MSYNLNGSDAFKLLTVFTKDDLGICISWFTEWFEEVVSSFSKFESIGRTNFSTAEAISTIEVFNYLLAEIPRFLEIFLKFCHIDSVEIGSNFVYASCYILRIYFGGSEITTCLINNQTYYTTKKSILSIEKRQWKLHGSWVVDPMSELSRFVYNKSHVTLHVKSNVKKVNFPFWEHFATTERCKLFCGSWCDIWFHQHTLDH